MAYIEDVMYGRRSAPLIMLVLRAAALLYGFVAGTRRGLYTVGIFPRKRVSQRVISIGNLTVGGTGKTPAVMNIAALLKRAGKHPAIISRGYGRDEESRLVVVSDGSRVLVEARTGGDEPVLIGSSLAGVPVVVGSDRYAAALYADTRFGIDTFVLDDGFQHMRLRRDLDIVLIDASDPFGNRHLFPAGILREPVSSLRRAGAVLITRSDHAADLSGLRQTIRRYTTAPIFTSHQAPVEVVSATGGEAKPLSSLKGNPVLAFAGIARPASFTSLLRSLGADVRAEVSYPDHYQYQASDLAALSRQAADERASMIITTEKDIARLKSLNPQGIWALKIALNVLENKEWEALLLGRI